MHHGNEGLVREQGSVLLQSKNQKCGRCQIELRQPGGSLTPVFGPPNLAREEEYIARMVRRDQKLVWG
jgi:hypothetical protein